jgi:hypothetical protein
LSRQVIKRIYFDNARQIVDSINRQRLVIRSVDFLSHSRDDRIGATMTRVGVQYRTSLFESKDRMEESRVLADAEGGDLHNSSRMASIEEIDFSHFSYDAVIEVHGCHAGTGVDSLPANICRRLSLALYMSGKQLAVVIGHGTRANPNARSASGRVRSGAAAVGAAAVGPAPGFRESVLAQDYRHGLRMVYFNGRSILATRVSGAIPRMAIISAIIQAQNAGSRGLGRGSRGPEVGSRGLFKGILVRYMIQLILSKGIDAGDQQKFVVFLKNNAQILWLKGTTRPGYFFGNNWSSVPTGETDLTTELSGAMLMEGMA